MTETKIFARLKADHDRHRDLLERIANALLERETLTREDIALRTGMSLATVRTQLTSIFDKTGVRRQTELVRIILNSVAPLSRKD